MKKILVSFITITVIIMNFFSITAFGEEFSFDVKDNYTHDIVNMTGNIDFIDGKVIFSYSENDKNSSIRWYEIPNIIIYDECGNFLDYYPIQWRTDLGLWGRYSNDGLIEESRSKDNIYSICFNLYPDLKKDETEKLYFQKEDTKIYFSTTIYIEFSGEIFSKRIGNSCGDINKDGFINASDAALILIYAAAHGAGSFNGTFEEYIAQN